MVTSLIFETVPEPMTTRFKLCWSRASVEEMVAAWQRWAPGTPAEVTANLTVVAEPGEPAQAILLFGASLREEAPTRELLQEFCSVAGASPEVDVRGGLAYWGVYPNFPDPQLDDWATAYHAGKLPPAGSGQEGLRPRPTVRVPAIHLARNPWRSHVSADPVYGDVPGRIHHRSG